MKLEIKLPTDGVEADLEVFDANGKKLDIKIGRIVVAPYFFDPSAAPTALYLRSVTNAAEEIKRGVVQLPGSSGVPRINDRTEKVEPKFYRAKHSAADEDEDEETEK